MDSLVARIEKLAQKYGLEIVYAFGSRAKEIRRVVEGKQRNFSRSKSDIDIGIKPKKNLAVKEKAEIGVFFEDLFGVHRTDVVAIPDAPTPLAFAIVTGELLYAEDEKEEAEYQLMIMRTMADLQPHLAMRRKMALES
jgi:predicted nucleotidyltransferase